MYFSKKRNSYFFPRFYKVSNINMVDNNGGRIMVYCQKCGTKNDDDAEFCKKCAKPLKDTAKVWKKEQDEKCEEECAVGQKSPYAKFFWGAVVILIGLWIIFSLVIPQTDLAKHLPDWLVNFEFWWLIGLIIAVAVIMTGIRILIRK